MSIFSKKEIPSDLWSREILIIPDELADIYENQLKENGLYEEALQDHSKKKGIYGGETAKETSLS